MAVPEPSVPPAEDPHRGGTVALFDGVCVMCNAAVRFLLERDRENRLRFASLQSDFAARLLARHGRSARDLDTVYVAVDYGLPSERLLAESAGIVHLLGSLGGAWRLARVLAVIPGALLNRAYRLIAINRYRWFGRYDTCPLPTPAERARFIDAG